MWTESEANDGEGAPASPDATDRPDGPAVIGELSDAAALRAQLLAAVDACLAMRDAVPEVLREVLGPPRPAAGDDRDGADSGSG